MKTSHPFFLKASIASFLVLFAYCTEKVENQPVDFVRFSVSRFWEGSVIELSSEHKTTLVIRSEQDFPSEVGCLTPAPEVDFNTHFVLAGKVIANRCANVVEEAVLEDSNTLTYQVKIKKRDCQQMQPVYFMAAVPVRYKGHQVKLDIKY